MASHENATLRADEPRKTKNEDGIDAIAVATDFSDTATLAVRRAAQLCRDGEARLHLIHVMGRTGANTSAVLSSLGAKRMTASGAVTRLRQMAARVAAEFGVLAETHLRAGNVPREISTVALEAGAGLVVVGNPPSNLLAEILRTNTALRVQSRTDLPLLAVSSPIRGRYLNLLLPSDLSPEAAAAGRNAIRLFPESTLILLHAFESPYSGMLGLANASEAVVEDYKRRARAEGMDRLCAFARNAFVDKEAVLRVDLRHPAIAASKHARDLGVDLVVLRPSRRWLMSGVTDHLIANPPCDLLLMP